MPISRIFSNSLKHCLLAILYFTSNIATAQNEAFVNYGCNIYVQGPGVLAFNPTITILGSYINLSDGFNDGTIELKKGHILLDSNWTNNSFGNVFTNASNDRTDGFVTFKNLYNSQIIDGINPTNFENLNLVNSRKILNISSLVEKNLYLDATLVLNSNTLTINNPDPNAIFYKSGFIKSETYPNFHGYIKWNIGSNQGVYRFPFGSDNRSYNDVNFSIDILSPLSDTDFIQVATYHTDFFNYPLPNGAGALELEARKVIDRYWIIETGPSGIKPNADISFMFTPEDVKATYNNLTLEKLKASRANTTSGIWNDMAPRGTANQNIVTIFDVLPSEFYEPWTLVNPPGAVENLFVPDAFSPNGDGLNDLFFPVFQVNFEVIEYEFLVFNRWGEKVFETTDKYHGWNGKINNMVGIPVIDVYSWVVIVKGKSKDDTDNEIIVKKYNGRVTLII